MKGGRFGDHAFAILSEIAEIGAHQTSNKVEMLELWSCSSPKVASASWVRTWKQEVSGYLNVTCLTMSLYHPSSPDISCLVCIRGVPYCLCTRMGSILRTIARSPYISYLLDGSIQETDLTMEGRGSARRLVADDMMDDYDDM